MTENMSEQDRENREHVERIADTLDRIARGEMMYCEDTGELLPADQVDPDDGNEWRDASMWDYFSDVLDINYTVDSEKEYKAIRLMVACGGPNIYVNTFSEKVELYWWGSSASAFLSEEAVEAIDELGRSLYEC